MRTGSIDFVQGTKKVRLLRPDSLAADIVLKLPEALPGSTLGLTVDTAGQMAFASLGSGTVTSVDLAAPAIFSVSGNPITGAGTITLALATQVANRIWAGPASGDDAAPAFRALVYADISGLVGTGSSTIAAGNDSRFHTQNTDTGTSSSTFQVGNGASGPKLKNVSGALEIRNAADSGYADITVGNLTVQGTTTTVHSETMTVDDNIVELNSNVTSGTPTENAGVLVRRGGSTSASFIWDESNDRWAAGLDAAELPITRRHQLQFTNSDLSSGILTVTHGLGLKYVSVVVVNNSDKQVIPDDVTFSSTTALSVDLSSFGVLSGNWQVVVIG